MPEITLHKNSKYNKANYGGYCAVCYEDALFRHVMYDGGNCIICTRCHTAKPLLPKKDELPYMYSATLTFKDKIVRLGIRIKAFFTGRASRPRFDFRLLRGK